jgi:ABC-type multidrug transport system fused ATPase/permease subunit
MPPCALIAGHRQLLSLARAVLRGSRIVCLDEVTAHVSGSAAAEVLHGNVLRGATVLLIAHQLQSIVRCDRIAVLAAGQIVECGTTDELLADPQTLFTSMCRAGRVD